MDEQCERDVGTSPLGATRGSREPREHEEPIEIDPYLCLHDPAFLHLWEEANGRVLTWDEFRLMPMPRGVTAQDAWDAVRLLRKHAGISLGPNERREATVWMNLPREERVLARDIAVRGSAESPLGAAALHPLGLASFVGEHVREIVAAFEVDGTSLGYEDVRAVLLGEAPLVTVEERLVANYLAVYEEEFARARARVDGGTAVGGGALPAPGMAELYGRMVEGVRPILVPHWNQPVADNVARFLASMGRFDGYDVPGASSYIWNAGCALGIVEPFGALFESLARKAFLVRGGMPALALLPMSAFAREAELADGDSDTTRPTSKYLRLMARQLDHLEGLVEREEERRRGLVRAIKDAGAVNLRQKDVLSQMLDDPSLEFDYASYAERFQVAYNTARSDLSALVHAGLVEQGENAGAARFRAVPGFQRVLGAWLQRTSPLQR